MSCKVLPRGRGGFSLVEIMLVIVIIALLAGAVSINVRGSLIKAKQSRAKADIATIEHALSLFWQSYNRYPTNDEGLLILCKPSDKLPEPLLPDEPLDPWGNAYQYVCPGVNGQPYSIICLGADGREGGSGVDADITNEDLRKQGP